MTPLLLTSILVVLHLCAAAGQSECSTPDGRSGKCVSIFDCSSLLKLVSDPTPAVKQLLRSYFCKHIDNTPWVCCPSDICITADRTEGTCIEMKSCPHLANILQLRPMQDVIQCESPQQKNICCSLQSKSYPAPESRTGEECQLSASLPDPNSECCGVDASGGGNRIVGGTAASIDEYPWLAIIEYVKDQKTKLLCGGVLISGQYVLTAGHCLVGPVLNVGTPVNVRLGEYDTSNPGPDCVEVEGGGEDCNDGALIIPIEKIIPHPEYNPSSELKRHDIALIRLDRIMEYTDFIRPICLPAADFTTEPQGNASLYTAGWGAVSDVQSYSDIKLKVTLPYLSYQDCQPSYNVPHRRVPLWEGQICAGGVNGKDSCRGDSGGPLVRQNEGRFELVGIVSFGPTPCGMENVAGVYSKVFHYLPWIKSQIVV